MKHKHVSVTRLDGSTMKAELDTQADEMSYAVVHRGDNDEQIVIVRDDGNGRWREVRKCRRGDQVVYGYRPSEHIEAEVIHVVEESKDNPLVYVVLRRGDISAETIGPNDIQSQIIDADLETPQITEAAEREEDRES